ncbi:31409_t:CDS:2, partial [Gigaspora margarita]
MHLCIEFSSAAKKRRKEVIKVRTITYLKKEIEDKYQIYISYGHYCLQIVKDAKQFASAFASYSVIILQDNKAKFPLGIPAVGKTFRTIQTACKPVEVPDHDFPKGSKQKLIPSVYLTIDPEDSNDLLHNVKNTILSSKLKLEYEFKPILVLLVEGGPNENPRHLKNIKEYYKLFIELNLDYFTIKPHAPEQFAYNFVERSISMLLRKFAGIVLPIDNFGSHLDSNEVFVEYVDKQIDPFNKVSGVSWSWIEIHCQICWYSLNIQKCNDFNCCSKWKAKEATDLLAENDRFLPSAIKESRNRAVTDDCLPNSFSNEREILDILIPCISD